MNILLVVLGGYFLLGALALLGFDLATGRIRSKFTAATLDTQAKLAETGNVAGYGLARVLLIASIWLFWPAILIGAASKDKKEEEKS